MRRITWLAALLALALPLAARAQQGTSAASPAFSAVVKETRKFTISAIDKPGRVVTLKNAAGDTASVECGDEVKNFAQLKVGDVVKTTYTEALTVHVEGAGEAEATSETHTSRAKPGEKPSGGIMERTTAKAKITAIDKVQVGNTVVVTYTVAHAISVTSPTATKSASTKSSTKSKG